MDFRFLFTIAITSLVIFSPVISEAIEKASTTTSGSAILVDYSVAHSQLRTIHGSTSPSLIKLPQWRQAVFELSQSANTDLGWQESPSMTRSGVISIDWNTVPLAMLTSRYDFVDSSAEIHDAEVFVFSPLISRSYNGDSLRFRLDSANILSHAIEPAEALQFDADDGQGFRSLIPDQAIDVSYSTTGFKQLLMRAIMADGTVKTSISHLNVVALATPAPTETLQVTASTSWQGTAGTGQAYIYLAESHTELTNPIVVVEGLDIDNSIDWPVLYDLLNRENMLEDLRSMGYDAVVLDFTDSMEPIERNAFVLTELLQTVNSRTPPGTSTALIGASLGGLVARYGLLWMEDQNILHGVRNFISFDVPHDGANIPLGLQEWLAFFDEEAEAAAFLLSRLKTPAARQMLLYHLESSVGNTANPDPAKAVFSGGLTSLGGWPTGSRLVSVANGSGSMTGQGFNAGDQLVLYEYESLLVDIIGNIWAVPDGGIQVVFDGKIDPIIGTTNIEVVSATGTLPWDNAPGGSRASLDQLADVPTSNGDIIALEGSHSFIPTVSALALASNDPFHDIAGDASLLDNTGFDQVYFPVSNQEHIEINAENKTWILAEIQSEIVVSLISGDTTESGDTATFTIAAKTAPTAPVTISLSSDNPLEGSVAISVILPTGSTLPQLVTVTGQDDDESDGDVQYRIITGPSSSADKAYHGVDPGDVQILNLDNEMELIFSSGFES